MKLYEIAESLRTILDSPGGELSPEAEQQLDALSLELTEKADGIAAVIREREAEARAMRIEAERFSDRAVVAENAAKRLKGYLQSHLAALAIDRLETPRFKVWRQANPLKIEWTGSGEPPQGFKRVKVEPDMQAAKAALDAGQELPDGFKVSRGEHLRIK